MRVRRPPRVVLTPLLLVAACTADAVDSPWVASGGASARPAEPEPVQVDDRPVTLADAPPPAVMGGTLTLAAGGARLVVSDPDRDLLHIVDVDGVVETAAIELEAGALPWRTVEGPDGLVHVALRGTGEVATIDPIGGDLLRVTEVCAQPRGLAVDELGDVRVACAAGELVTLQQGIVVDRQPADADVRDVVMIDGVPWLSRFRGARLGPIGEAPIGIPNFHVFDISVRLHPSVAWRTRALPDGRWAMLHQVASDAPIHLDDDDDDDDDDHDGGDGGGTGGAGGADSGGLSSYGGNASSCAGLVSTVLTLGETDGDLWTTGPIRDAIGAVDFDRDPTTGAIALAIAGEVGDDPELRRNVLLLQDADLRAGTGNDDCSHAGTPIPIDGQAVAVAFDGAGMLWVQSREPNQLVRIDPGALHERKIATLSGPSRYDTGHAMFHLDAGAGIACMSCHPEGADDGRVWRFDPLGARHTPTLDVGLKGTEPFHWQGDLDTFTALVDDVFTVRMGAMAQSPARAAALERWVLEQRTGPAAWDADDDAVVRGQAAFEAHGCASCHDGADHPTELGFGFALQTPPLRGIALHPPYMHDGRSDTLRDAVVDMATRTRPGEPLTAEVVDDLVAYLRTL